MVNNKGYVFTSVILMLFILITLSIVLFKDKLSSSVNQASFVQGVMDNIDYNYTSLIIQHVTDFKANIYGNLSNSSLIQEYNASLDGILLSNNPQVPLLIEKVVYTRGIVNVTYPLKIVQVGVDYPVTDLLIAESAFNPQVIQECLDAAQCSNNKEQFDSLLVQCFPVINGFIVGNYSVPQLFGSDLYVDLILFRDKMTLLYPFQLRNPFIFSC